MVGTAPYAPPFPVAGGRVPSTRMGRPVAAVRRLSLGVMDKPPTSVDLRAESIRVHVAGAWWHAGDSPAGCDTSAIELRFRTKTASVGPLRAARSRSGWRFRHRRRCRWSSRRVLRARQVWWRARRRWPYSCVMPERFVCAQVTATGAAVTWHLEGLPGQTRCGMPTENMKDLPKADWDLVLRPCLDCQRKADLPATPVARTA